MGDDTVHSRNAPATDLPVEKMRGINEFVQPQVALETIQHTTSFEKIHSKVKTRVKVTGELVCSSEYYTDS
jgi:hypothetical protein